MVFNICCIVGWLIFKLYCDFSLATAEPSSRERPPLYESLCCAGKPLNSSLSHWDESLPHRCSSAHDNAVRDGHTIAGIEGGVSLEAAINSYRPARLHFDVFRRFNSASSIRGGTMVEGGGGTRFRRT